MILSGEDSCCPGLELSLHTQTSCPWSPHPTGVAGDLGDPQLWGGSYNWPGPWWPCGETHCGFLPGSCFTLSVTGRGQQSLPGRPRTPCWPCQSFLRRHHIRQAPLLPPSPPPGLTWAAMFWQLLSPPCYSVTDISPISVLVSFTHLVSASGLTTQPALHLIFYQSSGVFKEVPLTYDRMKIKRIP